MYTTTEDAIKAEGTRTNMESITKDPEWVVALQKRKIV